MGSKKQTETWSLGNPPFRVDSRLVLQQKGGTLGSYFEVLSQIYCLGFALPLGSKTSATLIPSTTLGFAVHLIGPCRRDLFCRANMKKEDNIPKLGRTISSAAAAWKQYI